MLDDFLFVTLHILQYFNYNCFITSVTLLLHVAFFAECVNNTDKDMSEKLICIITFFLFLKVFALTLDATATAIVLILLMT